MVLEGSLTIQSPIDSGMQYIKSATSARDQGYLDVAASASDAENGKKGMTMQQDRRRPWFTLSFLITTGLITALLLLLVVLQTDHTSREVVSWPEFQGGSRVVADCGYSPEEAKAKGCVWDLMSFGWTHPACYNKAESEKWLNDFGPWKWYLDLNATQEVAEKDLPYTELVYAEQGYHVQHCLYVLKLLHLAAMTGHPVTDEAIPLAHTGHCTKMISDPAYLDFKHINTKVDLLLARCVTLD